LNPVNDFSEPILAARGLSVVYGKRTILEAPLLEVNPGQVLVLIGPNGSGKTTLLLCLSLLLKPTTGSILYKGEVVSDGTLKLQMRRRFAVAFQDPLLLNTSVWENVILGLKLRGFKSKEIKTRAQHWMERFGIARLAKQQARTLSGGEAQRANLARAFALQPEVLFLDEPFSALDTPTRQSLFGDMVNILQETRFTTIMVTHDRNEAQTLANHVIMINNGRIVQTGTPQEIFTAPVNEEVARFVGIENVIAGTVITSKGSVCEVEVGRQIIAGLSGCLAGDTVSVCIRPEDITLSLNKLSDDSQNVFAGKVTSLVASGPMVRVSLDCGFPLVALVTRISADELHLQAGKTAYASFKPAVVHVISAK
jgi:molybdopterin-binding protein